MNYKSNELPFQQERVQPIHARDNLNRDIGYAYAQKSNTDNIRTLNNQKVSFGTKILPGKGMDKRGQQGQVFKHLPDKDYVQSAGGFANTADDKGIFLILPNGETQVIKNDRFFNKDRPLVPGSTIVVPRDPRPFDWLALTKTITPILADSATAIATVEALLKD